jgi:hypothetical protein
VFIVESKCHRAKHFDRVVIHIVASANYDERCASGGFDLTRWG